VAAEQTLPGNVVPLAAARPATEADKNRNLVQRLLTALVGIPITVGLIYWGGIPFAIFIGLCCVAASVELCAMGGVTGPMRWFAVAASFATPFFFTTPGFGVQHLHWMPVILLSGALLLRMASRSPLETASHEVMVVLLAGVYGSVLAYLVPLRGFGLPQNWAGAGLVILVVTISWMSDTGAYFAGRFFGKHKFAPRISPAKTWEGFFGGMAAAVFGVFFTKIIAMPTLTLVDCAAVGVLTGIVGPLGDLAESMVKRSCKVKDSGHLFPGHGGMMDRIDSLMFNGVVVYGYYHFVLMGRPMGPSF
jgi:phosphatidate cytidylyltransferase